MSFKGKALKAEHKTRISELENTKIEAARIKAEREALKSEAELVENSALQYYRDLEEAERKSREDVEAQDNRREAEESFKKYDSNNDGVIEIKEIQTRILFDRDRDGVVTEEEAKYYLDDFDQIDFDNFVSLAWPKIKPILMLDSGIFKPPASSDDADDAVDSERENDETEYVPDDDQEEHFDEDGEDHDRDDEDHTGEEDDEVGEGEVEQVNKQQDDKPERAYDPETQKIIEEANEARNQFNVADRELREIESELNNLQELLDKDFGPDEEYAPLSGQCFNFEDREYIYKLCPFDRAVQQPKSGGAETR